MTAPTLATLYQRTSKHSHYQVLAGRVAPLLDDDDIAVRSRHERERLGYVLSHLDVTGLDVADIGGNTGFFSFEMLDAGARRVDYHEGNTAHHDFVAAAAGRLGLDDRLHTHRGYVDFRPGALAPTDCTLLLNVLHHFGDDFGDRDAARDAAKQRMLTALAVLSRSSRWLVFQLGFNWKGDRYLPLFDRGTKAEMIDFVRAGTAADWDIVAIGIAERHGDAVTYRDLSAHNQARDDRLGEFLNRPLFLMRSRHRADA